MYGAKVKFLRDNITKLVFSPPDNVENRKPSHNNVTYVCLRGPKIVSDQNSGLFEKVYCVSDYRLCICDDLSRHIGASQKIEPGRKIYETN